MVKKIGKIGASLAVLGAVAAGSSAVAGAASNSAATTSSGGTSPAVQVSDGPATHDGPGGGHAGHRPETALTGTTADKVRSAALAKVPGGTIERVETNTDGGGPLEAHVRKSDGSEVVVLVDNQFNVTAVQPFGPPRG